MIDWLNKNGVAVQAIATVVLVFITAAYAYLTARMAKSAKDQADAAATSAQSTQDSVDLLRAQVELQRRAYERDADARNAARRDVSERRKAVARQLEDAARSLLASLRELHPEIQGRPPIDRLRGARVPDLQETNRVQALAAELGGETPTLAARAAGSVGWLRDKITLVQSKSPGPSSVNLAGTFGGEYGARLNRAIEDAEQLLQHVASIGTAPSGPA